MTALTATNEPIRGTKPRRHFVAFILFAVLVAIVPLAATSAPSVSARNGAEHVDQVPAPLAVPRAPVTVVEITAGTEHTCARLSTGAVKCWGDNFSGQLGLGDTNPRGDAANEMGDNLPAVNLGLGRTATQLTAGFGHTCALLDNATVKCWGINNQGQLGQGSILSRGDGPNEMGDFLAPVQLGAGLTAVQVDAGAFHTCARLSNNSVKCWGNNGSGRLGLGDTNHRGDVANEMGDNLPAVDLGAGLTAVELTGGFEHTCARLNTGTVKCWGRNNIGQLGLGDILDRGDTAGEMGGALPGVDLGAGLTAVQLTAGNTHMCARLNTDDTKCWGKNNDGQLGLGNLVTRGDSGAAGHLMGDSLPAVDLGTDGPAVELTLGATHSCARLNGNSVVKCWGGNGFGQLGLGNVIARGDNAGEMGNNLPALNFGTGRTADQLAAGRDHTCALLDNGTVKCWGGNNLGELGQGDTVDRGDGLGEMGDALPVVDLGTAAPVADPCPGPTPNIPLANAGANGYVFCSANNPLTLNARAPGVVHDSVTAIFWWSNPDQQFKFWFRGFPPNFQTLTGLEAGKYYFFQATATGGTIANTGGSATLAASGAASITTVAGANAAIWSGGAHATNTLGAYASITAVTAIFAWNNATQQFNFWFRGFPDNFQTLTAGIERGKYYFFQAPAGQNIPMN